MLRLRAGFPLAAVDGLFIPIRFIHESIAIQSLPARNDEFKPVFVNDGSHYGQTARPGSLVKIPVPDRIAETILSGVEHHE